MPTRTSSALTLENDQIFYSYSSNHTGMGIIEPAVGSHWNAYRGSSLPTLKCNQWMLYHSCYPHIFQPSTSGSYDHHKPYSRYYCKRSIVMSLHTESATFIIFGRIDCLGCCFSGGRKGGESMSESRHSYVVLLSISTAYNNMAK